MPCHEKTNILVSDLVRHKPGCTVTEDGKRFEISDIERRGCSVFVFAYAKFWFSHDMAQILAWRVNIASSARQNICTSSIIPLYLNDMTKSQGIQHMMVLVVNFFVFLKLLFFTLLLLCLT